MGNSRVLWEVWLDGSFWVETDAVHWDVSGISWVDKDGSQLTREPNKVKIIGDTTMVVCQVEWFQQDGQTRHARGPIRRV